MTGAIEVRGESNAYENQSARLAVLVAGICAVAVLAQAREEPPLEACRLRPVSLPRVALPSSLASTRTAARDGGMNWVDGALNENATFLPVLPQHLNWDGRRLHELLRLYRLQRLSERRLPPSGDIYYMAGRSNRDR